MSEPLLILEPDASSTNRQTKIIKIAMIVSALMIVAGTIALDHFTDELDTFTKNILFLVAALELVLAMVLPLLIRNIAGKLRYEFYEDKMVMHTGIGNIFYEVPYDYIVRIYEDASSSQMEKGLTTVYIETTEPVLPTQPGTPGKNQFTGLVLPDLPTIEDPVYRIETIIKNSRHI